MHHSCIAIVEAAEGGPVTVAGCVDKLGVLGDLWSRLLLHRPTHHAHCEQVKSIF